MSQTTMCVLNAMKSFQQLNGQILDKISAMIKMYGNETNPEKFKLLMRENMNNLTRIEQTIQSLHDGISLLASQDKLVDMIIPCDSFLIVRSNILDAIKELDEIEPSTLVVKTIHDKLQTVANTMNQVDRFVNTIRADGDRWATYKHILGF